MTLELIKIEKDPFGFNFNTQKENLVLINRLFQQNADDESINNLHSLDIDDFYIVTSGKSGIKLQGNYTEKLINKLCKLPFVDRFTIDTESKWYDSRSVIETTINNKVKRFTLDITLCY